MAPVKTLNSPWWGGTLAPAGPTPEAICIMNRPHRATAARLHHSTFAGLSLPLMLCRCFLLPVIPLLYPEHKCQCEKNPSRLQQRIHSLFLDTTCNRRRIRVFQATPFTFPFFSGHLKKPWRFNTYVYCKSQNVVRIHMNNAQFITKHENKISMLALLCWFQLSEETNIPQITSN